MAKYKICPSCGKKNSSVMVECTSCETDLSNTPVIDENEESKKQEEKKAEPISETPKIVRTCECGEDNPATAKKCRKCGEDISDIIPRAKTVTEQGTGAETASSSPKTVLASSGYHLVSYEGNYSFNIISPLTVIGREREMADYLSSKMFVSRVHAQIIMEGDILYIENISQTNHTYINNNKIISGRHRLNIGDEIGLGGSSKGGRHEKAAYFIVKD